MANKFSANPANVKNFTQNAEINLDQSIQDYSEFLPVVNRTESLQRFFGSTVNQLLSSGSTQSIDAYWGRLAGRNYNPDNELFNVETDATRLNYQFQPGTVSKTNGETSQTVSYINWLKRLESLGSDLDNHDKLFSEPGYVLDLPVNYDMIINYSNYYWLEGNIPLIEIEATVTDPIDIDDITSVSQYTTPTLGNYKSVEFVTGLRVKFTGSYVSSTSGDYFADYVYYVENVGNEGGIKLVAIEDASGTNLFPSLTPYEIEIYEGWDTELWDSTPWNGSADFTEYNVATTETRDDLNLNKSYIVMERWAQDKNPWARTNKWFSIHALRVATEYNNLTLEAYLNARTRADRPIVEFKANMELYNTCKNYVETVDYAISIEQVAGMIEGVASYQIDSNNMIQNGDIVLVARDDPGGIEIVEYNQDFNFDFDSGSANAGAYSSAFASAYSIGPHTIYYEDAFVVSGVGTAITLIPHRTYTADEYVIVGKGNNKGRVYCYDGSAWVVGQNKDSHGDHPLFNLYDQNRNEINSFENNDFAGDKIFGYEINDSGAFDRELGFKPAFTQQGSFSDYKFEWTLSNNRYNRNIVIDTSEEISGYYYWKDWVETEYHNGWANVRGSQRVPIIQTMLADGTNNPEFELGTSAVGHSTEFTVTFENSAYRWFEHSYIDRAPVGQANPVFVWKNDTTYTVNTLISNAAQSLEFVDPYGNTTNITTTVVDDVTTTVNVSSSYEYSKIIYRNQTTNSIHGEIYISNDNQNRYRVTKNGQQLVENTDFTFSGTKITVTAATEENDVLELSYIADADLENVVYDVAPIHFYNSENNPFTNIGYDDLITHMSAQMVAMPGFTGNIVGFNNYYDTVRIHNYGGLIRQQIFETKKVQYLIDQEELNPVRALKNVSNDYVDFKNYFKNKVFQLWTTESWSSVRDIVDRAISDINIGKSEDFKYAHSDMAYAKQYKSQTYSISDTTTSFAMPNGVNVYGDIQNHLQVWLKEYDGSSLYLERPLVKDIDYTVEGSNVVLTSAVTLDSDPATLTIRWFDYRQLSHIPFSAVKLGFFRPTQVEILNGKLIGHDGSEHTATGTEFQDLASADFDVVTAALWDLELRIFNNLTDKHFISNSTYNYEMGELYPNPTNEFAYTVANMNTRLDDWFNRWAIKNNVTAIDNVAYDGGDEFTWNYSTVTPNLGSWRSLYVYNFGTDRPHTHPWEMLGHRVKPSWWDANYSWAAGAPRNALLNALKYGLTGDASSPNKLDIRYARSNYDWDNDTLVTTSAVLNGPVTANVVSSPAAVDAAQPFVFGDWSEIENNWRKSSEYLFALAEVYMQLKPYSTHGMYWMIKSLDLDIGMDHEQWINVDTNDRTSIDEMHNQIITSGIISHVRIVNQGTGYSSLTIDFAQNGNSYNTAAATASVNTGKVVNVQITDPGRSYTTTPSVTLTGPLGSGGVELEYVIDLNYHVTHLGFNALPAEEYVATSSNSEALAELLSSLDINYMLHVGGYTDKRVLAIELDGDYNAGVVRIPDNSYDILIDQNAPIKKVFYSGVKITEVEGEGYQVEGYDLDSKFFNYHAPSTAGNQSAVAVGDVTVTKYHKWRNETTRIPYKTYIRKRQDLYSFLLGLGKYYEGLGFDAYAQWEVEARAAIEWTLDSTATDPFYVNGIATTLTYNQGTAGVVQTVDVNYDGVNNILDNSFKKIRRNEMLVLRNEDNTEFSLKSSEDKIYGLGVSVVEYEHIITIDNVSVFNDSFYVPENGIGQNRVRLVGERTRNWNGRVEAPGYIVQDRGLMLNIESSVRELEHDWVSAESKALERLTRQTIGFNVGYSKPTYMTNTFISDKSAFQYETGLKKYRGTESAIEAFSRNKNIFGVEFEHTLNEEWMVRLGDYGDVSERNPLQFAIDPNKIKGSPQQFRFNESFVSDRSDDLIIDMHEGSPDAVSGDFNNPFEQYAVLRIDNSSISTLEDYQEFTRDAGLPLIDEIDYFIGSVDDIGDVFDPTQDYALIPNWNDSATYVQGDQVRNNGKVWQLNIETTGITNTTADITVRGSEVFPTVTNGLTLIANGETVTFSKTETSIDYDTITVDGTEVNPTVPSGDALVLDGITVNFIKTSTTTSYSNITLDGNVSNPTIVNSASRSLTVGYANDATSSLTTVAVNFNELSPTLTMQTIWINALATAGASDPTTEANARIAALETLRTAYVGATGIAAWETFVGNYFNSTTIPDLTVNPEFLGSQVNSNPGAAWETAARALINLDLALIADLSGNAATETESTMVSGTLNNASQFYSDRNATNNLLDNTITANNDNGNLLNFISFVETNGGTTIANGQDITVTNQLEYVTDNVTAIANKINTALSNAGAPADISASPAGSIVTIVRTNNSAGYRLGVSTDTDIGFTSADNDVQTSGTTSTSPEDLTLSEVVTAINNAAITGVSAQESNNVLRLLSENQTLTISTSTATDDLGLTVGSTTANSNTTIVDVDLAIGDVVTQINNASISNLTASQVDGVLVLTYTSDTLVIGSGTANSALGISANTYNSTTSDVENEFNESDWISIQDPAHFNIWTVKNLDTSSSTIRTTINNYDVYQTVDLNLGIYEICAGEESGDDALVKCTADHGLAIGDYVLIINSTCVPSLDGIHQVSRLAGTDKFFVDRYIEEKGFAGKAIPLQSVRFANSNDAEAILTNTAYVNGQLGLRAGDYLYVDSILDNSDNSLGYGGVYKIVKTSSGTGIELVRNETGKTNNSKLKNGILFSKESDSILIQHEVYDPLKGIIPGIADREIDVRSEYDMAYYNNSTDVNIELREEQAWGQQQVGTVWWDLANAIYINYDQGDAVYRQEHWGELFPTATIDVYEWTKSSVTPDNYADAVIAGTTIDGIELTGIPYSVTDIYGDVYYNWCEEVELNPITKQVETYYYFWVKNKTTTPTLEREYSVQQLANIILDPSSQQIDWIAATGLNTLLVSSLTNVTSYDDLLMQVNFDAQTSDYHQEYILLAEHDPKTYIPEWLHISLRDSLAGYTQASTVYNFVDWVHSDNYAVDDIVKGSTGVFYRAHTANINVNPNSDTNNDYWTQLSYDEINPDGIYAGTDIVSIEEPQSIPDLRLHPYVRYGLETRPHQSWFMDMNQARKALVQKLNDQLSSINLIDSDIPWQAEFERTFTVQNYTYDISEYWVFADWSKDDVVYDRGFGDYFVENVSDLAALTPAANEIAQVENSVDPDGRTRRQVFKYIDGEWVIVFKEKGTIKFNDLLWDNVFSKSGWDVIGWDTNEWDKSSSAVAIEIFSSFYNKIWIDEYQSFYTDLWFHMVHYAMREQDGVDWIFKTSYFNVLTNDSLEKQYNKYFNQNIDELFDYINTVKPFRSKLRDAIIGKEADDTANVTVTDAIEIRIQTNPVDNTVDETETRSFRLSVGSNGLNYSSQIVDDHKVLLGINIGPTDTIIPYLNNGAGALPESSGAFWINGERIEYTGVSNIASGGIGSGFSSGFSSGFGGVTLLTGCTRGTQGTHARGHSYADIIEDETNLTLVENTTLSDWGDNLTPAWNELEDTLLSASNTQANAVTIRAEDFGTIEPYSSVLYAQWLALQETAEAIELFQSELEELIETYWASI